jgi:hypothetical protein
MWELFLVLGIKTKDLLVLGRHSTIELQPQLVVKPLKVRSQWEVIGSPAL